jgi:hypothetical protein
MTGEGFMLTPEEVDNRLSWPPGRAERLARQRRLPFILLPDGRVRFLWEQIERYVTHVSAVISPPRSDVTPKRRGPHR